MKGFIIAFIFQFFTIGCFCQSDSLLIQNYYLYIKLWGLLKYYHPYVNTSKIDWDKKFLDDLIKLKSFKRETDINRLLDTLLGSQIMNHLPGREVQSNKTASFIDTKWISKSIGLSHNNKLKLVKLISNSNKLRKKRYVKQNMFIGNAVFVNENVYKDSIFPSVNLRLLTVARYWNIVNYFYPYKHLFNNEWDNTLKDLIPKFINSNDTISYHLAILEMVSKLNDGHVYFRTKYTDEYFGLKWVPFTVSFIDNEAIICGNYNDSLAQINDINIGDKVLSCDGIPIIDIVQEKIKYIPGANDTYKLNRMDYAIFNGSSDSVQIEIERKGKVYTRKVGRYLFNTFKCLRNPCSFDYDTFELFENSIGYINLQKLKSKDVKCVFKRLNNCRSLILDLRGYPQGTVYKLIKKLKPISSGFVRFLYPKIKTPGVFVRSRIYKCGSVGNKIFEGKIIVLINDETISQAEFTLIALKTVPNVITVGTNTAGSNGNVTSILLPGNFVTYMSGIGIIMPDGTITQGEGISPDIDVNTTKEDILLRNDVILSKAIEVLKYHVAKNH